MMSGAFAMRLWLLVYGAAILLAFDAAAQTPQQPWGTTGTTFQYGGGPVTTLAASPTDWITITGSTTKKTVISRMSVCGTANTPSTIDVEVIRRSTADSGGTSAPVSAANMPDSATTATATVSVYTANPTLGTAAGVLNDKILNLGPVGAGGCVFFEYGLQSPAGGPGPLILGPSSGHQVAINLLGATMPMGISLRWAIETTEQ